MAIHELEQRIANLPHVRHLLSLNRFAQVVSQGRQDALTAQGLAMLCGWRPDLCEPYLSTDYYRIQLLVDSIGGDAYHALVQQIEDLTADADIQGPFLLTGTLSRIIEIQDHLLASLSLSLGITLLTVLLLMLLLLGLDKPLIILIPNLFPLGGMALIMPLAGIPTTISSVMVFSVAFGIAVDDTIHLLDTFYKDQSSGFEERWRLTLTRDIRAITLTTTVLACGFSIMAFSSFIPTANFGFLLASGMVLALTGDLFFLPILLRHQLKKRDRVA